MEDKAISKESFIICACKNCDLWFTNPRPNHENIQNYYESPNYISHQEKTRGITDFLYLIVRKYTLRQKLNWVNSRFPKKGRLLDYGCGIGLFGKTCQSDGWETYGIEPNTNAAQIAESKNKLTLIPNLEALQQQKKFDVITLFHVLEHVHLLNKTVKVLLGKLKKRGLLFIAVPNRDSPDANDFQENWAAWDVPRHLYHFNVKSMNYLANKHECRIVETIPMKFDSFYVSLLSHQYIGSKNKFIKALKSGLSSNRKANNTKKNYSSLLFILKKK
ncbi:class I SAM-dependent methyltransferase [Cyclobacterium jeungdonense]|uniref:class I SAM-dependent methyltransferase n=1 Tax=Cyclobacterium jeungdonense TaxID=708087 RepID=UPI00293BB3C6|nr:class I SAM-dependent methyltransferase [Cyclobacterium jeungdonense]